MENSCRKKYKLFPKKWILASRYSEFRRNSALIPANAGLFHYAGNNPVRYIDPDGRYILKIKNEVVRKKLYKLYDSSKTFKQQVNRLLESKNTSGQKVCLVITTQTSKYAGNTVTNDSDVTEDLNVLGIDKNGKPFIPDKILKGEKDIQVININLDLDRIERKGLDFNEVFAEEIAHAANILDYKNSDEWNTIAKKEDEDYDYNSRPREIYAKNIAKKILEELKNAK